MLGEGGPVRRGCAGGWCAGQARPAGHHVGGAVRWSGEACEATMCWGVVHLSGEAGRPPCGGSGALVRRGWSGHHVHS